MGVILTNVFEQFPSHSKQISQSCEIKRGHSTFATKKRMQLACCVSFVSEVGLTTLTLKCILQALGCVKAISRRK